MLVRDLQCLLFNLYGVEIQADVRDYLVTHAGSLGHWEETGQKRDIAEKLLIEEGEEELGLALYLDQAVLDRLVLMDPRHSLNRLNLADFCLALEGVSHFNYVAWNAAMDKKVTLLELEMQAEVDKYVCARVLLAAKSGGSLERPLLNSLFDEPVFDAALSGEELGRYQDASRFAGRYCRSLESRFPAGLPGSAMLRELRTFYRWSQPAKLSHIRSAALA